MNKPRLTRALRDALELQSAAARFFSELAGQATDTAARKLLLEFARVEQSLALEVEAMAGQVTSAALPERASACAARIKTAPEWIGCTGMTVEQAIAVAFDCNRRAFHHHAEMAGLFEGRAADFFLTLAQSDEDRASMLERALDQRLAELASHHSVDQVIAESLDAVRRAGKVYGSLAKRMSRARTREFLRGMVEVCSLHAADIQRIARNPEEVQQDDPAFEALVAATSPVLPCAVEALDFESALRMAMDAQKRAALVHGMQARAFPGEQGELLLEIAEAERRHAATIASVLDRLAPDDELVETTSAFANAPRESWTCPAPSSASEPSAEEDEQTPPSLRLVAG